MGAGAGAGLTLGLAPCSKSELRHGVWQQEMLTKRGLKLSSSLRSCAPAQGGVRVEVRGGEWGWEGGDEGGLAPCCRDHRRFGSRRGAAVRVSARSIC